MTGRERILAVLAGQKTDHLAFMPITMMFAADILGVKYGAYARDHRTMADAQVKTAEMFSFDHVSTIGPPAPEAADLGARIQWYEDQPPSMVESESLLADKSVLARLQAQGPITGERVENRIRGVELLHQRVGDDLYVEGWVSGPCAEAADLRGINRLMLDFSDDPAFVSELFEFSVGVATHFAAVQIAAGADIIGVGDAAASLVGPRIYRELVWPWEKKLVDAIHAKGGKVRLHICGNTRRILPDLGALGCELVDIDSPVPIGLPHAQMGPLQTIAGNLDPVRDIRNGSPDTIMQALEALHREAGPQWVVAAGCEIVRDTPHENLRAMMTFAQSHTAAGVTT
jgi:MtaA/CmuA family methyltransferase